MPSWPGAGGVGGTPTTAQYSTLSSTACPERGYGVATMFLPHTHTTPRYVRTIDRPLPEQLHTSHPTRSSQSAHPRIHATTTRTTTTQRTTAPRRADTSATRTERPGHHQLAVLQYLPPLVPHQLSRKQTHLPERGDAVATPLKNSAARRAMRMGGARTALPVKQAPTPPPPPPLSSSKAGCAMPPRLLHSLLAPTPPARLDHTVRGAETHCAHTSSSASTAPQQSAAYLPTFVRHHPRADRADLMRGRASDEVSRAGSPGL
ncbi:hypothetical protein V497_02240 [Pseudogymnoascus sp. VKM F-4516 (FW-969)]|nr:hypothetical protein V497_02240 [Pseudogymnoascus sp. VKM F-4516 (FW-969)]